MASKGEHGRTGVVKKARLKCAEFVCKEVLVFAHCALAGNGKGRWDNQINVEMLLTLEFQMWGLLQLASKFAIQRQNRFCPFKT